jgi:hypothetical protein
LARMHRMRGQNNAPQNPIRIPGGAYFQSLSPLEHLPEKARVLIAHVNGLFV